MKYWTSDYLYCDEKTVNLFLKDLVFKSIKTLTSKLHITQYFFLRYTDECGFHIRLRFMLSNEEDSIFISRHLKIEYEKFKLKKRSHYINLLAFSGIKQVRYEPEIERYGGIETISIAERQFQVSSKTCIRILKKPNDYSSLMGAALNLHLLLIYCLPYNKETLKVFLDFVVSSGLSRSLAYIRAPKENIKNQALVRDYCFNFFDASLDQNKDIIFNHLLMNIDHIKSLGNRSKQIYLTWYKENYPLINSYHLIFRKNDKNDNVSPESISKREMQAYSSLIHMTNNRIGIKLYDEAYLVFILLRFIEVHHPTEGLTYHQLLNF